ncbi:hypothetical protein EDC22_11150 [Tepidamorphus gemmatus]|uniref:Uncharacterized protein n=1 Tax=Tepidamorphus gemmatus TaxID=747076 RepID=A0A4R3M4X7_9HYPH|nr:hypothetical protein EDC22_11150 [Tepidamorphus gemmatus]
MESSSSGKLPPSHPLSLGKAAGGLAIGPTVTGTGQAVGAANRAARVRPDKRDRDRDRRRTPERDTDAHTAGAADPAGNGLPAPSDLPPIDHAGWLALAGLPRSEAPTLPPSGSDVRRAYHLDTDEPEGPSIIRTA